MFMSRDADKKPSYLAAFLGHPVNKAVMLASACTATFASIPYGWTGLVLVGVVALGAEILAALAIPDLPSFRASVDSQRHRQSMAERKERLVRELQREGEKAALANYDQMCRRVESLYETAGDAKTTLTRQDVEKLEDLTVDYLGLSAVNFSLKQRKTQVNEDTVLKRIASIRAQLDSARLADEEARQLHSALREYTEVLQRARRLAIRSSTLEATLLAMPDKMEEVYQLVIAAPYSSDMANRLGDSLSRLKLAEDVAAELDGPLGFDVAESPYAAPAASKPASTIAQAAQRAANSVKN